MRETSNHARVTWMLPAWQTAILQQLLGMLVITSFLNANLAQGGTLKQLIRLHECGTST